MENERKQLVGVLLTVIGTMIVSFGSHMVSASTKIEKSNKNLSLFYFLFGNLCVIIIGANLVLAAFAFAPQSLLAPLQGLTIVWNISLASLPIFGHFKPKFEEIIATGTALLGLYCCVYFGPKNLGRQNTFNSLLKPSFITLLTAACVIVLVLRHTKRFQTINMQIAFASVTAGIVGGLSSVFPKSAIEFYSGNQVEKEKDKFEEFILVVVIAVFTGLSHVALFNYTLTKYPIIKVVPVYTTTNILCTLISGGLAFDEFDGLNSTHIMGFVLGLVISVMSVAFLSSVEVKKPE